MHSDGPAHRARPDTAGGKLRERRELRALRARSGRAALPGAKEAGDRAASSRGPRKRGRHRSESNYPHLLDANVCNTAYTQSWQLCHGFVALACQPRSQAAERRARLGYRTSRSSQQLNKVRRTHSNSFTLCPSPCFHLKQCRRPGGWRAVPIRAA